MPASGCRRHCGVQPEPSSSRSRIRASALLTKPRRGPDHSARFTDGHSYSTICERVDCAAPTIATWKTRYEADGLAGLRGSPSRVEGSRADAAGGSADLRAGGGSRTTARPLVDAAAGRPAGRAFTRLSTFMEDGPACSRIDSNAAPDRDRFHWPSQWSVPERQLTLKSSGRYRELDRRRHRRHAMAGHHGPFQHSMAIALAEPVRSTLMRPAARPLCR